MSDLRYDPIINAVHKGITEDIEFNQSHGRIRAMLLLMFSAIDAMAFLNMPTSQSDVKRTDFIEWTERYLKLVRPAQLTGADLYGARCALLHTYSSESAMSRDGKCRQLMFVDPDPGSPVRETKVPELILVGVSALKTDLFAGIDSFLVNLFASPEKSKFVESRLKKLLILRDDFPGGQLQQMLK